MSSEKITLTRQTETPPVSLAQMLKNQYVSKEFNDILSATEFREYEIVGTAGIISARFVTMMLATEDEDLQGLEGQELKSVQERLAIKNRILRNPNGIVFVLEDCFVYAFGLLRQSLKRQSRKEAMNIAMSPRPVTPAGEINTKDKLFTKLGISGRYKNVAVEK